ncbi:flagellin [Mesorhizobium sp. CAU 1741]|uniref:flagellin n=1 Tax=Mesorhizobium sp. CAU 1741 TaxID=3140366 RepID=UPI00325BE92C
MMKSLLALLKARVFSAAEESSEDDDHTLDFKEHVDLSLGMKDEITAIGDTMGEVIGIGPISALDMNANSARMSALQAQKQLAMETINIVNTAPQMLLNLLT